ncbi:hypothetical protein GS682_16135 [Nostoc sp. B(2019)]|nr:hypothetical protein [Nostoc sp. B(2019)]
MSGFPGLNLLSYFGELVLGVAKSQDNDFGLGILSAVPKLLVQRQSYPTTL